VIDDDIAEVFIVLGFALGHDRLADGGSAIRGHGDAIAIQVITIGDDPGERYRAGAFQAGAELERFVGRQEVAIRRSVLLGEEQAEIAIRRYGGCNNSGWWQVDRRFPFLRWMAEAGVRAPLQFQFQRQGLRPCSGNLQRRRHFETAAIDFLVAEIVVVMVLAFGP